jgi:prepilin-type N-terminal cleavage/methylation domain-containing protein
MRERGVTLIEMVIVCAIAGLIAALSLPSLTSGLDGLRLTQASDSLVSFLSGAMNRVQQRQQVIEVTISQADNMVWLHSTEPGFTRNLKLPDNIRIVRVLPQTFDESGDERRFLLLPGASFPRIGVELTTPKGTRRLVSIDPVTGVPEIRTP